MIKQFIYINDYEIKKNDYFRDPAKNIIIEKITFQSNLQVLKGPMASIGWAYRGMGLDESPTYNFLLKLVPNLYINQLSL